MIGRFFALAFAITWLVQLPAVLARLVVIAGPVEAYMNPAGFGLFGPMIAALIVTRRQPGTRAFLRSLAPAGVRWWWYVAALVLPALGYVVVRGVYGVFAGDAGPRLYPPGDAQRVAAMIIAPIGEEIGWRGFALPRLQQRMSRLNAALLLGSSWGLWHLMMYLLAGLPAHALVLAIVFLVPGSICMSWLYNRAGGSALVAIAAHMGVHLNNPNQALPADLTPFYLNIAVYGLFAALALGDRQAWRSSYDRA
ncbi:MAG: CPBP family intramembrane metalloprotease [Myxococcales bacterium]|nr:CPBP family intramembrane metalloprotease [Myxococcales bacterium]